ncbi:MAG: glycosyltransferase family 2 protein [Phycisphaerales bacterium]|nr:MAG: glycosyltransferase family 2 protein [Phycisphaerales bacterium]
MVTRTCRSDRRILVGIPVYNEEKYVTGVLEEVRRYADHILVIDDGSTDRTPCLVAEHPVEVIRHTANQGYGRSMQCMICQAAHDGFEWLITMDCDEQHEPAAIPRFLDAIEADDADVISGSRYLVPHPEDHCPPEDRQAINQTITAELNGRLGLSLTDGFCGFKAYRMDACRKLCLDVDGYDFPMQFWVQAVAHGLRIEEIPVRLIYNDPARSFGGPLDVPTSRLDHYRRTMHEELHRCAHLLPAAALSGLHEPAAVACGDTGGCSGCPSS